MYWDDVTKPKRRWGIGLRKTKHVNVISLEKLIWNLQNQKQALWAKCIKKYEDNKKSQLGRKFSIKKAPSFVNKKALHGGVDLYNKCLVWNPHDGKTIRALYDD